MGPKLIGGRTMARPKGPATRPLAVRLPAAVIAALDEYAAQLAAETPGLVVSRNEVIRVLLLAGLEAKGVKVKTKPAGAKR